jgi:hypothetical protein
MMDFIRDNTRRLKSAIRSLLKDPIASEIEMALSLEWSEGIFLREVFQYLDKAFKFRPDNTWTSSQLYINIQIAIAGISDKSEKEIAKLASTWKCESFEEYMQIVSLLE